MLRKSRAQTTAEYAILFAVVIGAAVAMQVYIKRGLAARQKQGTDAFTSISATFKNTGGADADAALSALDQYEPYYLESTAERFQENIEQEHMSGGKVIKEKVSDISATKSGGYQVQGGGATMTRDQVWEDN